MKKTQHILSLIALTLLLSTLGMEVNAQTFAISGKVSDAATNESLPICNIIVKGSTFGTVANLNGEFSFELDQSYANDSLIISYIAYETKSFAVKDIAGQYQLVALEPFVTEIGEAVVRPMSPENYIRHAMSKRSSNYGSEFMAGGYFQQLVKDNGNLLTQAEGYVQSYAPNFLDSADSQQRLLLYQEVDNMDDLTFGKKKSEKKFKKAKKKANKEGEEFDEEKAREEARAVMIGTMSPSDVIEMDPIRNEEAFINPDRLEEYEFIYEENSSIQGREMIVIRFQSRGKVGSSDIYQRGKQSGRLYFDQATDALASVVIDHEMVIPGALKPILFLMGYSVSNPMIHSQVNYQFFQGRWYPQSTQFHMQIRMVNKHFFSENEESNLDVKMLVVFSDWNVDDAQEIPEDKRMKYSKNMEDQLQPLSHITWDSIHRVPFK